MKKTNVALSAMRMLAVVTGPAVLVVVTTTAEARDLRVGADAPTIQAAIDAAVAGDRVVVPAGFYRENIDLEGKAITLLGEGGASGVFLDGGAVSDAAVKIRSGEGRDTIVQGLTIRGAFDAGVLVTDSSPTIRDCIVAWNGKGRLSAGIALTNSGARIERCAIVGNAGGGVRATGALGVEIVGNEIRRNSASLYDGGGVSVGFPSAGGSALVERNLIQGNSSERNGGGLYVSGPATIVGNVIVGNTAASGGSGAYWDISGGSEARMAANTIAADDPSGGAALQLFYESSADLRIEGNVVVASGGAPAVQFNAINIYGEPPLPYTFARNDVWAGGAPPWSGAAADPTGTDGNVSVDPQFVAPAAADLRLAAGSPCVDRGDPAAAGLPSTDMLGAARSLDGDGDGSAVPDMGACEFTGAPHVAAVRLEHGAFDVREDGGPLTLTVRRDGGDLPAASVRVRASELGAASGSTIGALESVVTFAPGQTTAEVVVPIVDDGTYGPERVLAATIDRPDAGCVVGPYSAAAFRVLDGGANVANYFPLPPGTRWYYRHLSGRVTRTEVLARRRLVNGAATSVVHNSADRSSMYFSADGLGLRLHRISLARVPVTGEGLRTVTVTFDPPVELAGERVSMTYPSIPSTSVTTGIAEVRVGGLGLRRASYSSRFSARRGDSTTAGTISTPFDPLLVEGSIEIAGQELELGLALGPGLGIVKNYVPSTQATRWT
jgi:hypothetical protein